MMSETLSILYMCSMWIIPVFLIVMYSLPRAYYVRSMIISGVYLLSVALFDVLPFWTYGGLMLSWCTICFMAYSYMQRIRNEQNILERRVQKLLHEVSLQEKENVELTDEMKSREKAIERSVYMYSVIKGLAETISWKSMLPVIGRALKRFLNSGRYALYLVGEDGAVRAYYREGSWPEKLILPGITANPCYADRVWASDPREMKMIPEGSIAVPFLKTDQLFGMLLILPCGEAARNKEAVLEEASALQMQLFFGMERAKLYYDIEIRSLIDGLTGLYRRQFFDLKLDEEIARAKAFRTPFSLVFIDIDRFKKVNDTYGHQTGDEVLSRFGSLVKSHVYETDFCARYGGEEFVILCPRAEREGLIRKIANLLDKVRRQEFKSAQKEFSITISGGIAHFPADGRTAQDIVASADKALYTAKNSGRNCIKEFGIP